MLNYPGISFKQSGIRFCFLLLIMAALAMPLASCQSKVAPPAPPTASQAPPEPSTPPPDIEWTFQPAGIRIDYTAAPDLNRYGITSHTIMLAVFQLTDAADFTSYTRTPDGITRLLQFYDLDARRTLGLKNMVDLQTFFITPGSRETLTIDRVQDARWVGLVAGYFNAVPEQSSAVYQVPVREIKKGFLRKKITYLPGVLHIDVQFGAHAMHAARGES